MSDENWPRLLTAIAENRTAGLHIDLQNAFYTAQSALAFPEADKVARDLRASSIPNFWVAATSGWKVSSYRQFSFECVAPGWRLHDSLDTREDDLVLQKADQALFPPYVDHTAQAIRDRHVDTLLITGVKHTHCVRDAITGALRREFTVYVVIDATDCPMNEFDSYQPDINRGLPEELHGYLSVITSYKLKEVLFSAREKAAPVLS